MVALKGTDAVKIKRTVEKSNERRICKLSVQDKRYERCMGVPSELWPVRRTRVILGDSPPGGDPEKSVDRHRLTLKG